MIRKNLDIDNDQRWLILRAKISEENIKSAFRLFRENGIEPILIKGWAAAREYPVKSIRYFSDIDLCVAPVEFEKSLQIIAGERGSKLNIDLHKGLRHLDTVEWARLFQNSETVPIDDVPVRVLRAEDHLRILCVHWLTDGGAEREKLLDIFYLLNNRAMRFDWEYCFEGLEQNRRDWIINTVTLVCKYHKLDASTLPFNADPNLLPSWFLKALEREWASGTRLRDILAFSDNGAELWRQIKKRLRPNPIQSMVLMEGRFGKTPRLYYQIGSFCKRLKPLIRKVIRNYMHKEAEAKSKSDE